MRHCEKLMFSSNAIQAGQQHIGNIKCKHIVNGATLGNVLY